MVNGLHVAVEPAAIPVNLAFQVIPPSIEYSMLVAPEAFEKGTSK